MGAGHRLANPDSTRTHASARRQTRLEPVLLIVADGPAKGARLKLEEGSVVIGSDPECDLVIPDKTISRRHATVGVVPGGVQVRDLGSRNGTRYLGARIESAAIATGGSMKLGSTTVQVSEPLSESDDPGQLDTTLVAEARSTRRLLAKVAKAAKGDATVLLTGETGTGKTELAKALHALSPRAGHPLVPVQCGAIPAALFESQLFGNVRGAFTGADRDRPGLVAAAEGGTLLLEELEDLPLDVQPKLLRLLESHEYVPLGASRPLVADLRVVATSSRDLSEEVEAGTFRRDLYYRVSAVELGVPPLRERRDDIAPLARRFARELKGVDVHLAPATLAAFQCQRWPGNVRELKNAVTQAVTLGGPSPARGAAPSFTEARDEALSHFERDYLRALLDDNGRNVAAAARAAKLARSYFYTLLERHGLVPNPTSR